MTIVGRVPDVKEFYDVEPTWYLPFSQHLGSNAAGHMVLAVRGSGVSGRSVEAVVRSVDPGLPAYELASAAEVYDESIVGERSASILATFFAVCGTSIAAIGVYASMAFSVGRRRREIAVRVAVGGSPGQVLRRMVAQVGKYALGGIVVGVGLASAFFELMTAFFSGLPTIDVSTLVVSATGLAVVATAACYLPTRRALRTEPGAVLREG